MVTVERSVASTFWSDFRRRFSRGLATILPTVLTIALILWLFGTINEYVGKPISTGTKWLAEKIWGASLIDAIWDDYHLAVVGFLLAIVVVYIVGLFVASYIGRFVWRSIESLLTRLPLIRQIYPSIKQVTDFVILNEKKKADFSRVVAVEYPRKGVWSIGFVTSGGLQTLRTALGGSILTVFVPSSPTPVTGYTVTLRRDEVIDLPLSVDEALRFTISGGVILPTAQAMPAPPSLAHDREKMLTARTEAEIETAAQDGPRDDEEA